MTLQGCAKRSKRSVSRPPVLVLGHDNFILCTLKDIIRQNAHYHDVNHVRPSELQSRSTSRTLGFIREFYASRESPSAKYASKKTATASDCMPFWNFLKKLRSPIRSVLSYFFKHV